MDPIIEKILTEVAKNCLSIDSLKTRKNDKLDFHDLAIWQIRAALENAFYEGVAFEREKRG